MAGRRDGGGHGDLAQAARQFAQWRGTHAYRSRIPRNEKRGNEKRSDIDYPQLTATVAGTGTDLEKRANFGLLARATRHVSFSV